MDDSPLVTGLALVHLQHRGVVAAIGHADHFIPGTGCDVGESLSVAAELVESEPVINKPGDRRPVFA
jgi:hypothetical protein